MASYGNLIAGKNASGDNEDVDVFGGSLSALSGHVGTSHIREIDALGTTEETLDWSNVTNGICAVKLYVFNEAATTADLNCAAICIDPPNSIVRDAWLTAGDSLTTGSNRIPVPALPKGAVFEAEFRTAAGERYGISTIGIKRDLGSDALRVIAVGTEAPA